MKANELRIGNWAQDENGNILRVDLIERENRVLYYVLDRSKYPLPNGWKAEPIPLTEEWLIKFGFDKHESLVLDSYGLWLPMIGDKRLTVTIEHGNQYIYLKSFDTDDYKQIPEDLVALRNSDSHGEFFVHQLQNLYFTLTGEELLVK